ncbi:MAG: RagB/SusD family nutrient uptake outer membrane protein [Bacteroidales bacterium]|nr:RagB/SusD family nutrient uptake outer membrane protein [Bacteroidales bacterium]
MKKIILSLSLISVLFASASCVGQLDITQHGVTGTDDYYKTDVEAREAIAPVYYQWTTMYAGITFFYLTNFPSDDMYAGGKARGANTAIEGLSDFTFDESNSHILNGFTYFYQMIYRCNAILDNIQNPDTAVKKQVVAEARFFRAWSYFYLTALWGTPPIADHVLAPSEYLQPNASQADLYALMESDLKAAIESGALAEKANKNSVVVTITKQAAQAMLGKVYVWQKKWGDAASILDAVILSDKYALYQGDYGDLLSSPKTDFCCENLLEANIIRDDSNRITGMFSVSMGWRGELFTWNGCDLDVETAGFGQGNPTKELYDAFVAREGVDGYRLNRTLLTYDQLKEHNVALKTGQTFEQNAGIFAYKLRYSKESENGTLYTTHTNPRYMRYAEVLLLAAEAHLMGGDPNKAKDYVNQIRTRAQLPSLTAVTMDDIKIEKRLELCFENVRYMDLQRWGDAATVLANKGREIPALKSDGTVNMKAYTYTYGGYQKNKHEYYPFPTKEMNVNTKLEQNPGWGEK